MYFLFCFQSYYPDGGWNDFRGMFGTFEEAQSAATAWVEEWPAFHHYQIVQKHDLGDSGEFEFRIIKTDKEDND